MSEIEASFGENGEPIEKNTDTAKCSACGAEMIFSPKEQQLACPYCGFTRKIDFTRTSKEIAFAEIVARKNSEWGEETHVFRCNNCGAREVIGRTEISKACSFCGTTNVTKVEELSGLKPNGVVPFAIDAKSASSNVVAWAKRKFFAPRAFKQSVKPEKIKGTYIPAFTFDTATVTYYHGRLGKYYTRTIRVNGKTQVKRELRYFNISGTFSMNFDDVLVQATTRIKQRDIDKISPFETNSSNEYSSEFLHGYTAQSNEKSGEACWEEAKTVIDAEIRRRILAQYTYDVVDSFYPQTCCSDITFKYVLLPLYVGHCNWKTKLYNFFVNGKNGKVTGRTPVSPFKVALASVLGALVAAGIIYLIYRYGG